MGDVVELRGKPKEEKPAPPEADWSNALNKFAEVRERMAKDRAKANEAVKKSYRLQGKKK